MTAYVEMTIEQAKHALKNLADMAKLGLGNQSETVDFMVQRIEAAFREPRKVVALPETSPGLYKKFHVRRTDARDISFHDKHFGCEYFVLDVTHDPFAIPALEAYIDYCRTDLPQLAADLEKLVGRHRRK